MEVLKSTLSQEEKENYTYTQLNSQDIFNFLINLPNLWPELTYNRHNNIIKKSFKQLPKSESNREFLRKMLEWTKQNNKTNLYHELQIIYLDYLIENNLCGEALKLNEELMTYYKELDDKVKQSELFLTKSRILYQLQSYEKARSALSTAKNISITVLCSSQTQSMIDFMNGVYLCDDLDYHSAVSYFLESYDGFTNDMKETSLSYIIVCKIILNKLNEIPSLLGNKKYIKFQNFPRIQLLLKIRDAVKNVDIKKYAELLYNNQEVIIDKFMEKHLTYLYNQLLDENILKIIQPYSIIRMDYIAEQIQFNVDEMEEKLRNMIYDDKIKGNIDHAEGVLVLYGKDYNERKHDELFKALEIGIDKKLNKNK